MNDEIVTMTYGDVTGDGIQDCVMIWGRRQTTIPFWKDLTLVVQDGVTGYVYSTPLDDHHGYEPVLWLGRLAEMQAEQIVVTIATGSSGATVNAYIYTIDQHHLRQLFSSDYYQKMYTYQVHYQDDYRVHLTSDRNNSIYSIDLSLRSSEYLDDIYDAEGQLKKPVQGWVNPMSGFYPVDYDRDGVYDLLVYQRIAGLYNADALGYVQNVLAWNGSMFELNQQFVSVYGHDKA
ncbi:hypothetical protein ABID56_000953 [Alkalibacillus flavidus]|uniref:VCBS repeat-containing protein n=1 Tax=Alkalibacillus flavidus TaxID=546021 RepID=A0ABV2KTF3_9BACI